MFNNHKLFSQKSFEVIRDKITSHLLPDIANIWEPNRTAQNSAVQEGFQPVYYKGQLDIPCRIDMARRYRDYDVHRQEILVNEYVIHLPYDCEVHGDWEIRTKGRVFHPLKLMTQLSYEPTISTLVYDMDYADSVILYEDEGFSVVIVGLQVTFVPHDTSFDRYTWVFGDGVMSGLTSPVHTYSSAGTYTVTYQSEDSNGNVIKHSQEVTVS